MERKKVFIQILDQKAKRWHNCHGYNTYEEAVEAMREKQEMWPRAIYRIRDNNLVSYTK